MKILSLSAGTTHVPFDEMAHLIARALWPVTGPDDDQMSYATARINLDGELARAVKDGVLPVKDPLTFGPHTFPVGNALRGAQVTVDDLRAFVADRGIEVTVGQDNADGGRNEPQAKPLQRSAAQDAAILQEIEKQGHDRLALPRNPEGKAGVKAAVRGALSQNPLFAGSTVFDKAWGRLAGRSEIVTKR